VKKVNDDSEVIIIGAGAAGLLAAREISKMKSVTILEARNRLGGRIFTTTPEGFSIPIEAGAEFIHGELPITMSILKEANIPFYEIEGETYQVKNGEVIKSGDVIEGISVLSSKVKQLKEDIPFSEFLKKYLNEEKYAEVKESAVRFVEGYDAADINKASTFALSKEWGSEGVSSPYRIEGGYRRIIDFLYKEAAKHGCKIVTSSMVKQINWKKNNAEVLTQSGDRYEAKKILVTVPAGILKSSEGNNAFIKFNPGLKEISGALNSIGYGPVIKVFFEFKEAFWDPEEADAGKLHRPGFIISDTIFTAWWSQLPKEVPLLTGWFAGPNVDKMHNMSSNHLIEEAVSALCKICRGSIQSQFHQNQAVRYGDKRS